MSFVKYLHVINFIVRIVFSYNSFQKYHSNDNNINYFFKTVVKCKTPYFKQNKKHKEKQNLIINLLYALIYNYNIKKEAINWVSISYLKN